MAYLACKTRNATAPANAETIRLVKRDMNDNIPISVSELKVGDEILVYYVPRGGRHFGKPVDETILEQQGDRSLICVAISAEDTSSAIEKSQKAIERGADFIEVRIDHFKDPYSAEFTRLGVS